MTTPQQQAARRRRPPPPTSAARASAAATQNIRDDLAALVPSPPLRNGSPVIPVAMVLTGSYLAWFAIHYWRDQTTVWPTDPAKDILQGKGLPRPDRAPPVSTAAGDAATAAGPAAQASGGSRAGEFGDADGAAIAKQFATYPGKVRYVWGGANPATGCDCSGLVNYGLCHALGLDIPGYQGGTFTGKVHGPVVAEWIAWQGCQHIGTFGAVTPQPGDIIAWGPDEHMGIAVSGTELVSAEDPQQGTQRAPIDGFFDFAPVVLRLRQVAAMGSLAGNKATGALLAAKHGWAPSQDASQWQALVRLWTRESGWSVTATNPSSGAYGIPQALPGSKMAAAGANWQTSAVTQITWGLDYIAGRYGTPTAAEAHEQQYGWY